MRQHVKRVGACHLDSGYSVHFIITSLSVLPGNFPVYPSSEKVFQGLSSSWLFSWGKPLPFCFQYSLINTHTHTHVYFLFLWLYLFFERVSHKSLQPWQPCYISRKIFKEELSLENYGNLAGNGAQLWFTFKIDFLSGWNRCGGRAGRRKWKAEKGLEACLLLFSLISLWRQWITPFLFRKKIIFK